MRQNKRTISKATGMEARITVSFICLLLGNSAANAQSTSMLAASVEIPAKRALLNCDTYYPAASNATGSTGVGFEVTSNGDISNTNVVRPSGNADLDAAASKCVTDAHLSWDMGNQRAIRGGFVANGFADVQWVRDGHSTLFVGCPFPIIPLRLNQQGAITLSFRVLKDGTVSNPTITKSSGFQNLDNAALSCVAKYKYVPASNGGTPVDSESQTTVSFMLRG